MYLLKWYIVAGTKINFQKKTQGSLSIFPVPVSYKRDVNCEKQPILTLNLRLIFEMFLKVFFLTLFPELYF